MVKCPFCGFANEDGALFCEQCKSDISSVTPAAPPTPLPESIPAAEIVEVEVVEAIPEPPMMADVVEDVTVAEVVHVEEPVVAAIIEEPTVHVPMDAPTAKAPVEPPPEKPPVEAPAAKAPEVPAAKMPEAAPIVEAAAAKAVSTPAAKSAAAPIPAGAQPKLVVLRGLKVNEEYNIFPGDNYIGRADEKPVDIDLTFQEPEDRVWTSRQHALMVYDDSAGMLTIEDLSSANGTFVNRERVYPGQPKQLSVGSTVQIGTVHMRVKV